MEAGSRTSRRPGGGDGGSEIGGVDGGWDLEGSPETMGNNHSLPGPNEIVLLQYGSGYGCDCGPARFEPSQAAGDERLLARGLTPEEVTAKIQELNVVMRNFRNPLLFILPPMFIGLIVFTTIQFGWIFVGPRRGRMLSSFECPRGLPRTSNVDKLVWPMNEGDTRVCGEADKYHAEQIRSSFDTTARTTRAIKEEDRPPLLECATAHPADSP